MRNFQDEDLFGWETGLCIGVILLMALIIACMVFRAHQRPTPNEARSQKLAEMPVKKLKTNIPKLPPSQPKTVWIKTVDGWIEEIWINL